MPVFKSSNRLRRPTAYFDSHTQQWHEVGLGEQIDTGKVARARGTMVLLGLLIAGVLALFSQRQSLFPGHGTEVRIATVVVLVILGVGLARALGRGLATALFRRMEPGTAGTVGFLIRLLTVVAVVVLALRIAGLDASTLAVGGAFTAVILGLAAQQTLANMFAGLVTLTTRPFRVGERVRLHGGAMAGEVDGIVSSLGLFYTTLVKGADRVMIPNSVLLQLAVIPMREPDPVELRVRLPADVTPGALQESLIRQLSVETRYPPHIELEELDDDQLSVLVSATPATSPRAGAWRRRSSPRSAPSAGSWSPRANPALALDRRRQAARQAREVELRAPDVGLPGEALEPARVLGRRARVPGGEEARTPDPGDAGVGGVAGARELAPLVDASGPPSKSPVSS